MAELTDPLDSSTDHTICSLDNIRDKPDIQFEAEDLKYSKQAE